MALPAVVLVGGILRGSATHQVWVLVDGKVHYVSGLVERRARRGASQQEENPGSFCNYVGEVMSALYKKQPFQTRWASFENPTGAKGQGGQENRGAKGRAFEAIAPGETKVLLDVTGCGLIHRLWLTVRQRAPHQLRALRLDMFWDGAAVPAVSVPLGDFWGAGLGLVAFENAFFASPEGRSFVATIPMPFRTAATITLTNESSQVIPHLFYDINYSLVAAHNDDVLYFHAHWRRENPTTLGQDFAILPRVAGSGRFLGASLCVITDPVYKGYWWGEGEVKVYLDGDEAYPTLVGTGTEDYIGTGWGQGTFAQRFQGCLIADKTRGWYSFYRFHVPDPIYFQEDCRVTIQQIGGALRKDVPQLIADGAPLQFVSVDGGGRAQYTNLLDEGREWSAVAAAEAAWCNYYRQDDWAAAAYFYLDVPANDLPPLPAVAERTAGLMEVPEQAQIIAAEAFYVPRSLRPKPGGLAFNLQNPGPLLTLVGLDHFILNGMAVDLEAITIITMNGEVRPAQMITPETPLPFSSQTTLRVQVNAAGVSPGAYQLAIAWLVQEQAAVLQITAQDSLK